MLALEKALCEFWRGTEMPSNQSHTQEQRHRVGLSQLLWEQLSQLQKARLLPPIPHKSQGTSGNRQRQMPE